MKILVSKKLFKRVIITLCIIITQSHIIYSCPLCTGQVSRMSPPFFSDELYDTYIHNEHDARPIAKNEHSPAINDTQKLILNNK